MKTVNCVVVTYNRLALLKQCIEALQQQTYAIKKIIVIDNSSTDGTDEFLNGLSDNPQYHIVRTEKNLGGAGGFSLGVKHAILDGCDHVWLMDDDTIPQPDSLEQLMAVGEKTEGWGFLCSRVNWTDGKMHLMNKPGVNEKKVDMTQEVIPCKCCTFVSVLIDASAILEVGLPIKEFFIWSDDIEYTQRIIRAGYPGYYVPASVVEHRTKTNYSPQIDIAPVEALPRFYYQVRNTIYTKRQKKNLFTYFLFLLNYYRLMMHRIDKRADKSHNAEFKRIVRRGFRDGLRFYPQVEYLRSLS